MENKNNMGLLFVGIAVILGVAIFKQIDFEQLSFKKPALAIVYILTFSSTLFLIIKGRKQNKQ